MKCCVIGGSGHIGQFLVGMLLDDGYQVTIITSGKTPIPQTGRWSDVTAVRYTYARGDPHWAQVLQQNAADIVIDILGADVPATYAAVRGAARQLIVCGSLWMLGEPRVVPTPEETQSECPFPGYAVRYQELCETRRRAASDGFPFAAIMPPNIAGPGKVPLECLGGRSIEVHRAHQRGEAVPLPEPGQTLIGPCDAEDVAKAFFLAATHPDRMADEIFNVGSSYALTARQLVEVYSGIYGIQIPIEWTSWQHYSTVISPDLGANFHFKAHMCPDITKIRSKLGYEPGYTPEEALERGVDWMKREHLL